MRLAETSERNALRPDDILYVSVRNAFCPAGSGAVIRYDGMAWRK